MLIDRSRNEGGNPWGIKFFTMFHQTNDAELFRTADELHALGPKLEGNRWRKGKKVFLPLYEAKMVQAYDHRAAGVVITRAIGSARAKPSPPRPPSPETPNSSSSPAGG